MSLMSIFLTSGDSNATWNPLKSPAEVLRTASTTDAKIDEVPVFSGSVKRGNGALYGKRENWRRTV